LFHQGALLARSFFDAGFDTVLIGGNALHTYGEFSPLITALGDRHEMFHFTLEPVLDAIIERVNKRGGDKTEDWLASHVEWMRTRPVGDTIRIDNTSLTPSETLAVIARHLADGEGLLSRVAGGP
jgi:hypothetical protein